MEISEEVLGESTSRPDMSEGALKEVTQLMSKVKELCAAEGVEVSKIVDYCLGDESEAKESYEDESEIPEEAPEGANPTKKAMLILALKKKQKPGMV